MHVLVVQTGREIVRQESGDIPSRQRCLWDPQQIYDVLAYNRGVTLHMCEMPDKLSMSITVFNVMHSISFLKFSQHLVEAESNVQLVNDGFNFPPNLKLLHWDVCPLKTLPLFRHHHLVELDLRYSNLESLWNRTVKLINLRRLDVTGSKNLIELPDLSTSMNFEELVVEGCIRLRNIPESLSRLYKLTKLNAIHCGIRGVRFTDDLRVARDSGKECDSWKVNLNFLYEQVQLNFLTDLSIEGQINFNIFPRCGYIDHISFSSKQKIHDELMIHPIRTSSRSSDFYSSNSLTIKQFRYRELNAPFTCYFHIFSHLTELKLVNLNIRKIPYSIRYVQGLEKLDLSGNDFEYLPKEMGKLPKLKYLSLHNCRKLKSLPQLTKVEMLILSDCVNLESLLEGEAKYRHHLLELWLDNCKNVQTLSDQLDCFTEITYLDLSRNDFVTLPSTIRKILSLETLFLNNCKKLKSVEELPPNVTHLYAHGCDSLEKVSIPPNHSIKHLEFIHCPQLNPVNMNKISREGKQRCVCLTESGAPSRIDDEVPRRVTLVGNFRRFLNSFFRKRR